MDRDIDWLRLSTALCGGSIECMSGSEDESSSGRVCATLHAASPPWRLGSHDGQLQTNPVEPSEGFIQRTHADWNCSDYTEDSQNVSGRWCSCLSDTPVSLAHRTSCTVGILAFRLLGGRFWAISPSSYTNIGSFARRSLPATENYATRLQRIQIEQMGRRWGCHTCGSKRGWSLLSSLRKAGATSRSHSFVGDHMPPKSVAAQMNARWWRRRLLRRTVPYRFYPQCVTCSSQQGSLLSSGVSHKLQRLGGVGGGREAYFHGFRPRLYHGAGLALGVATLVDPNLQKVERWSKVQWKRLCRQLKLQ